MAGKGKDPLLWDALLLSSDVSALCLPGRERPSFRSPRGTRLWTLLSICSRPAGIWDLFLEGLVTLCSAFLFVSCRVLSLIQADRRDWEGK